MRLALAQARRALGRTFPNPSVGAVVFRGDRVLGRGYTRPPGGPHAEVVALERALARHGRKAVRGASLAVTLEPCCHLGRTGPCSEAITAAGIARVYVGHRDPHPQVDGGGVRRLRRAGVAVRLGVLEAACREQHRGFLSRITRGRPFVTLKLAASLDGRIATAGGESRWITGPAAREAVHRLRARSDAVMVGSITARSDDPELTARLGRRVVHRPVRVIVDGAARLPTTARVLAEDPGRTWVLCRADAPAHRRRALAKRGARVIALAASGPPDGARGPHLPLREALERLAAEGLGTVLVEGGGGLAAALLRGGLVDELVWIAAPRLLGGDARAAVGPLGLARLATAPRFVPIRQRRLGDDLWLEARAAGGGGGAAR